MAAGKTGRRSGADVSARENQPDAFPGSGPLRCASHGSSRSDRAKSTFLCVEILDRIDTAARFNEKLFDYFQMGVRYVWVLDPLAHRAFCYTPGEMHEVLDGVLRASNPDIEIPLSQVFETGN
jgi:Uma2 family endonuclease